MNGNILESLKILNHKIVYYLFSIKFCFKMSIEWIWSPQERDLSEKRLTVLEKKWIADQILKGRISAYKMAKEIKLRYKTVHHYAVQVQKQLNMEENDGRPRALDQESISRLEDLTLQIAWGLENPRSDTEWRNLVKSEYLATRQRKFPTCLSHPKLSRRSIRRYQLWIMSRVETLLGGRVFDDDSDYENGL